MRWKDSNAGSIERRVASNVLPYDSRVAVDLDVDSMRYMTFNFLLTTVSACPVYVNFGI